MARILVGFMGAGKTSVGRLLSEKFYDMDSVLVDRLGMPISDFFALEGEAAFRQMETDLLGELLQVPDAVISSGGGVVLSPVNRALLKGHEVIFLEVDFETLYDRLSQDRAAARPLFLNHSKDAFRAIFEERQNLYREVATITVAAADRKPEEIAQALKGKQGAKDSV